MMDQYEQTRQSRSNAERAFRKKGDEIIEAANANAEDVYAHLSFYTADMIGAIRELMDHTNDSMNDFVFAVPERSAGTEGQAAGT